MCIFDKSNSSQNVLISVIIPVYNSLEYLEKCVKSILRQTYKNIEIILVDDGSTDGSSEICDLFRSQDRRIFVIHKKNGGLVSARKAGIDFSSGKYIVNIDSDDWIDEEMIQRLLGIALCTDADIVTSGLYREYKNTQIKIQDSIKEGLYSKESELRLLYGHLIFNNSSEIPGILPNLVTKLVKGTLLKKVYLKMNENIIIGEDAAAVYSCCALAKTIVVTHNKYYHYIMRNSSIVHSKHSYYFSNINELFLFLKRNFSNNMFSMLLLKQLEIYFLKLIFWGLDYGFEVDNLIPYYCCPQNRIPLQSKIIIYGAGNVGHAFYKQIKREKLYKLIAWLDEDFQKYQKENLPVDSVDKLYDYDYDYIILAFKSMDMADYIKENLIKKYSIEEQKIIWISPCNIIDEHVDWSFFNTNKFKSI